ncbi:unnamed protein product [Clavelina lepadiformis]|uniref:Helicase ARIP4 n=1 Tax=Clavelina lepadiformis TaxID=159417 RepID=A0ABP0GCD2_CLALP
MDVFKNIADEKDDANLCARSPVDNREDNTEDETKTEEPIGFVPDFLDIADEADSESDMSDVDLALPSVDLEDIQEENGDLGLDQNGSKVKVSKKRKKHDPTKRRKIRKLLGQEKLNTETLLAIQEEEQRRKRLEEQALHRAAQELGSLTDLNQDSSTIQLNGTDADQASNVSSAPPNDNRTFESSYLANLLASKEPPPQVIKATKPPEKKSAAPPSEVICISSDSEDEKPQTKSETIDVSSESSDDVICTGEVEEEKPEPEDVNNSGMHIEDAKNQRDSKGRVLVNVNRPTIEPEIFLAPQLANAVQPHQIGGIRFMFDNIVESLAHYESSTGFGCILAHSMGLGKTLQVISFVDIFLRYTTAKTVLCVVPVNTLMNWVAEFNMWLPPKSKCVNENPARVWPRAFTVHLLCDIHKTVDSRSKVVSQWNEEGGVLLLGYEMYRLLTSRKPRKKRRRKNAGKDEEPAIVDVEEEDRLSSLAAGMQDSLLKPGPDLIVCDEGHRIKNSHASISQMLKNVRTKRRIVLTGYPLQNNLMEYWCMVDFVRPNFLGTKQEFSNMFERPILNGQCADSTESDVRLMRFRSHVLHSLLKGFVQRRSHSVLRDTLPLKEEHVLLIRLSEWQKKLYNKFWTTNMVGSSGSWCSSLNPIKAFSICCKIWNHPDVFYRTVVAKTDSVQESNGLDPDFDIPESVDGLPTMKPRSSRKQFSNSPAQELYNAAATVVNRNSPTAPGPLVPGSNSSTPPSITQTSTGFNPFGNDDKEKGVTNYDWAKDLLAGYSPGVLEISGKMVILMQLVHSAVAVDDRILVFSQSLSTLSLIEEFLAQMFVPRTSDEEQPRKWAKNESYFRLDGNTHTADREKMINQFNSPQNKNIHLFLLSTRAGCLGINLIGANRVVVFDASWNPCHDAQAVCRVYRYGQQKTCHIYRLVCDQSMERKIYERQVSKQGMADRVVDKLNPAQIFTRQDVLSLMEYSNEELPKVDFENIEEDLFDPLLAQTCKLYGHWFTKKPFTHESLLLDCKDQRLTKAEKRAAEKSYERDKLASSAYNYGRQSYTGFYGSRSNSPKPALPRNASTGNLQSHHMRNGIRPIANVRPMQSTPLPMQLQSQLPMAQNQNFIIHHKSGMSVQRVVASTNIPLPPQNTSTTTTAGQSTKIHTGETIFLIHGRKGTYIRTLQGRIFAVRSNDANRFGPPTAGPSIRIPGNDSLTSHLSEGDLQSFENIPANSPSFNPAASVTASFLDSLATSTNSNGFPGILPPPPPFYPGASNNGSTFVNGFSDSTPPFHQRHSNSYPRFPAMVPPMSGYQPASSASDINGFASASSASTGGGAGNPIFSDFPNFSSSPQMPHMSSNADTDPNKNAYDASAPGASANADGFPMASNNHLYPDSSSMADTNSIFTMNGASPLSHISSSNGFPPLTSSLPSKNPGKGLTSAMDLSLASQASEPSVPSAPAENMVSDDFDLPDLLNW